MKNVDEIATNIDVEVEKLIDQYSDSQLKVLNEFEKNVLRILFHKAVRIGVRSASDAIH